MTGRGWESLEVALEKAYTTVHKPGGALSMPILKDGGTQSLGNIEPPACESSLGASQWALQCQT